MFDVESLVGRQIHQFRVDRFIARGAMGMIYSAHDMVLSRTVALKLIPKSFDEHMTEVEAFTREEALKRLIQEAKVAGKLAHPNIVTIYSFGETDEFKYICMEFVSGKTLDEILREKPLSEGDAFPIFEQILLALDEANKEHIVHRDIKPANIMITGDNRVKVMDFGIAKLPTHSMTVTGMVLGTPYYMSPEQVSAKRVDIRSDIFSVGAVFYQALTGAKPFEGANTAAISYQIMLVDPPPPNTVNAGISPSTARVILKALAKDPANRYQTPGEMLADLRAAMRKAAPAGADQSAEMNRLARELQEATLWYVTGDKETTSETLPPAPLRPSGREDRPAEMTGADTLKPFPAGERYEEPMLDLQREPEEAPLPFPPEARRQRAAVEDRAKPRFRPAVLIGLLVLLILGNAAFLLHLNNSRRSEGPGSPVAKTPSTIPEAPQAASPVTPSTPGTPPAPSAVLAPPPAGSLRVETIPAGAVVYLDGVRRGEAPMIEKKLAAGKVGVLVEWPDQPALQAREIEIRPDETSLATFILEASTGQTAGAAPGGDSMMDRIAVDTAEPMIAVAPEVSGVLPAPTELPAAAESDRTSPGAVDVTTPVPAAPKTDRGQNPARLTVNVVPADAQIRIVNSKIPYKPGMQIPPGNYQIEASKRGFETQRKWVLLSAAKPAEVAFELREASPIPDIKRTVNAYKQESAGQQLKGIKQTADAYQQQSVRESIDGIRNTVKAHGAQQAPQGSPSPPATRP